MTENLQLNSDKKEAFTFYINHIPYSDIIYHLKYFML